MSFKSLPIDQRPYKRWASISPNDTTVYNPPTDAILLPVIFGATAEISLTLIGSDDVEVGFQFGIAQSGAILPLSVKKMPTDSQTSVIGLWRD